MKISKMKLSSIVMNCDIMIIITERNIQWVIKNSFMIILLGENIVNALAIVFIKKTSKNILNFFNSKIKLFYLTLINYI